MANTFELIASYSASGTVSSIDFSSIPSTFTDLVLKISGRTNAASLEESLNLSFNGSTASFTGKYLLGNGAAASSGSLTRFAGEVNSNSSTSSTFSNTDIYIPNYAGSSNKSYSVDSVQETNGTTAYTVLYAGLWSNTAAINQITLTPPSGSFVIYSTAYLYGVKNS